MALGLVATFCATPPLLACVSALGEVVKELVADTMTVGNMQNELKKLIEDQEYKNRMLAEYEYMADRLGPAGAPQHAARKMLELLKK